ncbi:MAG: hypothetical protein NDJ89_05275 [Oligoflexia bacterium]|nr:hypothetical protein [Oligoflexia bacterium]
MRRMRFAWYHLLFLLPLFAAAFGISYYLRDGKTGPRDPELAVVKPSFFREDAGPSAETGASRVVAAAKRDVRKRFEADRSKSVTAKAPERSETEEGRSVSSAGSESEQGLIKKLGALARLATSRPAAQTAAPTAAKPVEQSSEATTAASVASHVTGASSRKARASNEVLPAVEPEEATRAVASALTVARAPLAVAQEAANAGRGARAAREPKGSTSAAPASAPAPAPAQAVAAPAAPEKTNDLASAPAPAATTAFSDPNIPYVAPGQGKDLCASVEYRGEGPGKTLSQQDWAQFMNRFHEAKKELTQWLHDNRQRFPEPVVAQMERRLASVKAFRPPLEEEPDLSWRGIGVWAQDAAGEPALRLGPGLIKLIQKQPARGKFELARLLAQTWSPCELAQLGGGESWSPLLSCLNIKESGACGMGTYSEAGWAVSSVVAAWVAPPGCTLPALKDPAVAKCLSSPAGASAPATASAGSVLPVLAQTDSEVRK